MSTVDVKNVIMTHLCYDVSVGVGHGLVGIPGPRTDLVSIQETLNVSVAYSCSRGFYDEQQSN